MPVPAVKTGESPRVSSGSQIAVLGKRYGLSTIVVRTAPTQTDQAVTPLVAIPVETSHDVGFGRVGLNVLEQDTCLDRAGNVDDQARSHQSRIRDDKGTRDSQPGQLCGKCFSRPAPEHHAVGERED